jgi:signal transduction histidine kinase/CheY-like chemotaxis protein
MPLIRRIHHAWLRNLQRQGVGLSGVSVAVLLGATLSDVLVWRGVGAWLLLSVLVLYAWGCAVRLFAMQQRLRRRVRAQAQTLEQATQSLVRMERAFIHEGTHGSRLATVMAYLNFLQETEGLSEQAHAYVSDAVMEYLAFLQSSEDHSSEGFAKQRASLQTSSQLLALINDLLAYAQILQGNLDVSPTEVEVRKTLQHVHDGIAQHAADRSLECKLVFASDLPTYVRMDAQHVSQIVFEVLSNAVKFTRQGRVHVHVALLSQTGDDAWLRVSVTDTGCGIAAADQTRIFEPFVQLHSDRDSHPSHGIVQTSHSSEAPHHSESSGHGLGLAMAQSLAHALGGQLHVTSRVDVGSTFDIDLPVRVVDRPKLPSTPLNQASTENKRRFLVVDDHPLNRLIAISVLQREFPSAILEEADNGTHAIEKMMSHPFDLVFMDLVMPDLMGVDVVRRIRNAPGPCHDTTVVALTANISDEAVSSCEDVGITHVLPKPLDATLLVETVYELLDQGLKTNV